MDELTPQRGSLEEAYLETTAASLEYGDHSAAIAAGNASGLPAATTLPSPVGIFDRSA